MISIPNSPMNLEVLTAGLPEGMNAALTENGADGPAFVDIINNLGLEGAEKISGLFGKISSQLSEAGIDGQQLQKLQQMLKDGKNLPPAAEIALQKLQSLVNSVKNGKADPGEIATRLNDLIGQLPEKMQQNLTTIQEKLNSIIERKAAQVDSSAEVQDQQETEETDSAISMLAAIDDDWQQAQIAESDEDAVEQMSEPAEPIVVPGIIAADTQKSANTGKHSDKDVDTALIEEPATEVFEQSAVAAAIAEVIEPPPKSATIQQSSMQQSSVQQASLNAQAMQQKAAIVNQANERSPAFDAEVYGETPEVEVPEVIDEMTVEVKNQQVAAKNNLSLLASNRANQIAWQATTAAQATVNLLGGGDGAASGGLSANSGQVNSFLQMMSQSGPQVITQNIHKAEWGTAVGDRINWMIGKNLQMAQIKITPAHLGPIEMKVNIEKNNAQVTFVSQHQVVRDALEQAIPRLREMLQEQDLDLVDVDIRDESNAQAEFEREMQKEQKHNLAGNNLNSSVTEDQDHEEKVDVIKSSHLLDAYA